MCINTNSDKDTLYDFANSIITMESLPWVEVQRLPHGQEQLSEETAHPSATETPATPDEEGGETPGFEAVFAVVGLSAVIALLRRKN